MSTQTIKLIVLAVVLGLLAFFGWRWLQNRDKAKASEATIAQGRRTGEATIGISDNAIRAQDDAATLDTKVGAQRVEITHKYEALKNENETVRDFDSAPVPVELRRLARDARIARDRLGSDAPGGELDDAGKGTKR